ncbi:MAG: hypothetical protein NW201_09640 [Gemmatimonadales bacterium]|nr:hypothetical protein [Gemmatimonadales bacterium]
MNDDQGRDPVKGEQAPEGPARAPWVAPELRLLPSLTDLTLQTGGGIGGGGIVGGGGSTVF